MKPVTLCLFSPNAEVLILSIKARHPAQSFPIVSLEVLQPQHLLGFHSVLIE